MGAQVVRMYTNDVGRIVASVKINGVSNGTTGIRCDALVDTRAAFMVLPSAGAIASESWKRQRRSESKPLLRRPSRGRSADQSGSRSRASDQSTVRCCFWI